ncbi:hypothetical protein [Rubneribacter sp.]|nr:hypothetical protein [Candidatus Rubneribacter avistercoris]
MTNLRLAHANAGLTERRGETLSLAEFVRLGQALRAESGVESGAQADGEAQACAEIGGDAQGLAR